MGFSPVSPGDKVKLSAGFVNRMIEMANAPKDGTDGRGRAGVRDCRITIKNMSGATVNINGILGVGELLYADENALDTDADKLRFRRGDFYFKGIKPTEWVPDEMPTEGSTRYFCVLEQSLKDGEVGSAILCGLAVVTVNIREELHRYAEAVADDTAKLQSCPTGRAEIVWRETGEGNKLALVYLGSDPRGTFVEPMELTGTGDTANTDEWDAYDQPEGKDGVTVVWYREFWAGSVGDPKYGFTRTGTYDSYGRLVKVSAEVRTEVFNTAACTQET